MNFRCSLHIAIFGYELNHVIPLKGAILKTVDRRASQVSRLQLKLNAQHSLTLVPCRYEHGTGCPVLPDIFLRHRRLQRPSPYCILNQRFRPIQLFVWRAIQSVALSWQGHIYPADPIASAEQNATSEAQQCCLAKVHRVLSHLSGTSAIGSIAQRPVLAFSRPKLPRGNCRCPFASAQIEHIPERAHRPQRIAAAG